MALMESTLADFEVGGVTRTRSGSVLPGVAPSNAYPTADGVDVVIAGNADAVFRRLTSTMGRPDLATDDRFASHQNRGENAVELDEIIGKWTAQLGHEDLIEVLREAKVPVGPINTAETMLEDAHFQFREMIVRRPSTDGWMVPMNGVVPKFLRTPGDVQTAGPALGAHTDDVLRNLAGLEDDEVATLRHAGVV